MEQGVAGGGRGWQGGTSRGNTSVSHLRGGRQGVNWCLTTGIVIISATPQCRLSPSVVLLGTKIPSVSQIAGSAVAASSRHNTKSI